LANVPYPLTAVDLQELRAQIQELIRQVFEEKIGGADLGDVFSLPGDVLTLVLGDPSGLTKEGNVLAIDAYSTGGLQISSNGLATKLISTGGLESSASGLGINLDGTSLTLGASGIKVTDPLSLTSVTLDNTGLNIKDTAGDHTLNILPAENYSANRILSLVIGDAARTITLSGNPTLADWFDQTVKTTASPVFVTVKLSGLTDDYIPYHASDALGLANGPMKADVDSAVSLKHAAVTVSAPIDLTGQAIKLVNDAAATVTEIDTGALANVDTVIPTSKAVTTAIAAGGGMSPSLAIAYSIALG
jgi:hypothetical protein